MKDIKIIEYSEEYRDSAMNLLKQTFPSLSKEDFSWRFDSSHDEHKPIIVCAVDSGKVISFNSWNKWLFMWEGKTFVGYQSGDSATDKNYRRMGIWRKIRSLGEQIAKDRGYIDFLFGFPGEMSFNGVLKEGHHHVGTYDKNIRIINPFLFYLNKKEKQFTSLDREPIFLSQKNKITPVVDSKYIEWRYHRNPKDYRIINYSENNDLAMFVVRHGSYFNKRYRISVPEVKILDCRFTSYEESFVHNALKHIESLFSRKAVWLETFFNEGTEKGKALKHHFRLKFKNKGVKLTFQKINPVVDNDLFFKFDNWDLQPHVVDSN